MDTNPTIRAATDTPSRDFYLAYLNSPGWRVVRNAALQRAHYKCERCPSKRDLQVHHKSYARLGAELPEDVEVVCETCHRGEHLDNPDQTSLGIYLKIASAAVKADPWGSIADLSDAMKHACAELKIPGDFQRIASALAIVCGNRLKTQPPRTQVEAQAFDARPFTKDEARDLLCRLDTASEGGMLPLVRRLQMPHAAPVGQRAVDRLKAAQFVSQEILESIARCEALEREEPK